MDVKQRWAVVNRLRPLFSMVRQCKLLDTSRSGLYYQPTGVSDKDLSLMKLIDRQYMARPFYGSRKLAAWLNEQGFKTRNKQALRDGHGSVVTGPRPFSLYSIRWILHNPFFTGKVLYKGQLYPGVHQAIIDEDLFNRVQEKLKVSKNRSKTFSPSYRQYLLKGIARCIYCGYPLWAETSTKGFTCYREPKNSRSHFNCPGNGKSISGRLLDDQIDSLVKSFTLLPSWR